MITPKPPLCPSVRAGNTPCCFMIPLPIQPARRKAPLAAQLAAILCGQAHRLDCTLPDDLHLAAKAAADVQVLAPGSVRVNLTLRDVELKDLTPTARPDAELQVAFAAAANREFDGLITALYGINGPDADPLDLCFWLQNRYGSTQGALRAELTLALAPPRRRLIPTKARLYLQCQCAIQPGSLPAKTKKQIENSPER